MAKILSKTILADSSGVRITRLEVSAKDISQKALPGQFVALMVNGEGERIPLTVVDADKTKGSITLILQEVG